VEIVIVTVLFAILIPSTVGIFIGARKISGQSYIQHLAATAMGETTDILKFLRNQGFDLLSNGEFYLIRNPGGGSWLVKSDLPEIELYERYVTVQNAKRHEGTDDLYFDGDAGPFYEDPETKRVDITIIWSPDYLPLDEISHTVWLTDWQKPQIY
jgi:hypothetical protein